MLRYMAVENNTLVTTSIPDSLHFLSDHQAAIRILHSWVIGKYVHLKFEDRFEARVIEAWEHEFSLIRRQPGCV